MPILSLDTIMQATEAAPNTVTVETENTVEVDETTPTVETASTTTAPVTTTVETPTVDTTSTPTAPVTLATDVSDFGTHDWLECDNNVKIDFWKCAYVMSHSSVNITYDDIIRANPMLKINSGLSPVTFGITYSTRVCCTDATANRTYLWKRCETCQMLVQQCDVHHSHDVTPLCSICKMTTALTNTSAVSKPEMNVTSSNVGTVTSTDDNVKIE